MRTIIVALLLIAPLAAGQDLVGLPEEESVSGMGDLFAGVSDEDREWVDTKLQTLTLRERVAQLMIVTLQGGPGTDASDRYFLERYAPGGVVIRQVARPGTAADFVNGVRAGVKGRAADIPLLIGTNLYTLPIKRLTESQFFPPVPSPLTVGAAGDVEATERLATLMAEQLGAMGFNMHLGPGLTLAPSVPGAKGSIYCFGSDPVFVGESGAAFVKTFAEHGIVPMAMGFPGGGLNRQPGSPPVLLTPAELLPRREFLPFTLAIDAGAPLIQVGNVLAPTLGVAGAPASTSPVVITEMLRGVLKFDGVIVSGPLDTNDVGRRYDPSDAAVLALQAGADMVYWMEAGQRVMKTVDEIVKAVEADTLSQEIVDAAFTRVLTMKIRQGFRDVEEADAGDAARVTRDGGLSNEAYAIERQSITLLLNRAQTLPLTKDRAKGVIVTGVVGVEALHEALETHLRHVGQHIIGTARHGGDIYDFEVRRVKNFAEAASTIVFIVPSGTRPRGAVEIVRAAREGGARVVVVLMGYPDNLMHYTDADAIVLTYCDQQACAQSMRAVADVLAGKGPMARIPVEEETALVSGQARVFNALEVICTPAGRLPVNLAPPFLSGFAVPYDPTEAIKKTVWDFGDGTKSKKLIIDKAYDEPGRYPVTLTVTDRKGDTVRSTMSAIVD
ncbi:MAG: PKD domain-containing protein [bacterium]|nr:PKD domain-containing protein [bacterium]